MKKAIVKLKSMSPYSQSKHYEVDKLEKESNADYEKRTWRNRCHTDKDGSVFIPPMAFKNCIAEAAKYLSIGIPGKGKSTYTKHFEAGVMVTDPLFIGLNVEDVQGETLFVPSDGRRGGSKRVSKWFPTIAEWNGTVEFLILDETITEDVFAEVIDQAGKFIGVGRFRPRNNGYYGRFTVESIKWV